MIGKVYSKCIRLSRYDFSVLNQRGIAYVAMTDRDMPLRIVFVWISV